MSNSPFVNYTKISPNRTSGRSHKIDTITIHCVVGQCSVETLGEIFAPTSRKASSNYGVGKDGRIGMYVEEKDRSWCSSSSANDNRAVTIEVASDITSPYAVTDKAYYSLVRLVADICKRNGIKKLLWKNDKSLIGQVDKQNMTLHMWFANKDCPGYYLRSHHYDIANRVNAILDGSAKPILFYGMRGSDVKELQTKLVKLKVASFTPDGIWGAKTEAAVKAYQIKKFGKSDGMVGKNTWAAIEEDLGEVTEKYGAVCSNIPDLHVLSKGNFGPEVKAMQILLNGYGYDCGEPNGKFDDKTEAAVEAFQKDFVVASGNTPDKIVGSKSWDKLFHKEL